MAYIKIASTLILSLLVASCASMMTTPEKTIVGAWQSTVGSFPVIVTYTDSTSQVQGYDAVPYQIVDGKLILDGEAGAERLISFNNRNEMLLTDPLTHTERRYTRVH